MKCLILKNVYLSLSFLTLKCILIVLECLIWVFLQAHFVEAAVVASLCRGGFTLSRYALYKIREFSKFEMDRSLESILPY
jgi:hypothetical protein